MSSPIQTLAQLRRFATTHTLFAPCSLHEAFDRMGFVQADPIRAPARAQDLILRHRVRNYRAGDLEEAYPSHVLEEGYLYAYGFLSRSHWPLVHRHGRAPVSSSERDLLAVVRSEGAMHPKDLEAHFGRERRTNPWGGQSRGVGLVLDSLLHRGLLRVSHRKSGQRYFDVPTNTIESQPAEQRLRGLLGLAAGVLAPVSLRTLGAMGQRWCKHIKDAPRARPVLSEMCQEGLLETCDIDGVQYVWPAGARTQTGAPRSVRFLAPFDPLVWDRSRFEHLWGWAYRFEAYVPAKKRVRGYYALPLLFGTEVIGWVNLSVKDGQLDVDVGYVDGAPTTAGYGRLFDSEVARVAKFLGCGAQSGE